MSRHGLSANNACQASAGPQPIHSVPGLRPGPGPALAVRSRPRPPGRVMLAQSNFQRQPNRTQLEKNFASGLSRLRSGIPPAWKRLGGGIVDLGSGQATGRRLLPECGSIPHVGGRETSSSGPACGMVPHSGNASTARQARSPDPCITAEVPTNRRLQLLVFPADERQCIMVHRSGRPNLRAL